MYGKMQEFLREKIAGIKSAGLYKQERVIAGPQQARVSVAGGAPVLNLCANNYLGLANHPAVVDAARQALEAWPACASSAARSSFTSSLKDG